MDAADRACFAAFLGHLAATGRIWVLATLRADARPFRIEHPRAFEASLAELRAWDAAHPEAVVIPGHDMPAWEALDELYR